MRFLEENSSVMVEDIMRKTDIIQNYVRETKPGNDNNFYMILFVCVHAEH